MKILGQLEINFINIISKEACLLFLSFQIFSFIFFSIIKKGMQKQQIQPKDNLQKNIDEQLIDAVSNQDFQKVFAFIQQGANVNYIRYSQVDCWYTGDTTTPLYNAVHSEITNPSDFINIIELLLKNGADPNFKARRGGWNHSTQYPLFSNISQILASIPSMDQKIRFLDVYAKNGGDLNQMQQHQRSKGWRGYDIKKHFVFEILDQCQLSSKVRYIPYYLNEAKREKKNLNQQEQLKQDTKGVLVEQLKNQQAIKIIKTLIELGLSPSVSRKSYSWTNEKSQYYEEEQDYDELQLYDRKENTQQETLIQRCIMNNQQQLVEFLIAKGANLQPKCIYTANKLVKYSQWPERLKARKMKENMQMLEKNECYKKQLSQKLLTIDNEKQKKLIQTKILQIQKLIRIAQQFNLNNEPPIAVCENRSINCFDLTEIFKVKKKIFEIVRNKYVMEQEEQEGLQKENDISS